MPARAPASPRSPSFTFSSPVPPEKKNLDSHPQPREARDPDHPLATLAARITALSRLPRGTRSCHMPKRGLTHRHRAYTLPKPEIPTKKRPTPALDRQSENEEVRPRPSRTSPFPDSLRSKRGSISGSQPIRNGAWRICASPCPPNRLVACPGGGSGLRRRSKAGIVPLPSAQKKKTNKQTSVTERPLFPPASSKASTRDPRGSNRFVNIAMHRQRVKLRRIIGGNRRK